MKDKNKNIGKLIQEEIRTSGKSLYQIAKEAGIQRSTLQRVMEDGWGKQLDTAEKVLRVCGKKIEIK